MENIAEGTDAAVIRMAKETQTRVTSLEGSFATMTNSIKSIHELIQQHIGQLTVQPVNNVAQQVNDQDPEELAWMDDAASRATRTEQNISTVTSANAIEQTIKLGNTVFKSYSWVSEQIEAALKSRNAQDLTYGNVANMDTQLTPDLLQEKGNKQKKAIYTKLRMMIWNGQCPILEWVKFLCDSFREYSISALTLEEKKMLVWNSVHYEKQQELDHIRPGSPSFQHDTMPAYVARVVSIYEPELYSERFRHAYESRKQMRQESATRYLVSKWFLYRRAEPVMNWRAFVRQTIDGMVCFKLRSRLYERIESIVDLGKFQQLLYRHISLLRRDIMDPAGDGGSLAGLKVTQYDKSFQYDATGTQPMDVSAVDEVDIDFGREDLEVAVLERKTGCYNCGREGHIRSQCGQPKKEAKQTQQQQGTVRREDKPREGPLICNKCNKPGHSARRCVCGYCMRPGHDTDKCFKKQRDQAGFQ